MNKLRKEAEKLRTEGYSYGLIQNKLGISKSTMSHWFKDKPFRPNQEVLDRIRNGPGKIGIERHNEKVRNIVKLREEGVKEIGRLSKRDLWLLGVGLYIGEGAKSIEQVKIVNGDARVICLGIRWLKEICGLDNDNITIRLHIYPDNDPQECIAYWQKVTKLPEKSFRKIQIDRRINKLVSRQGKLPYGTAHMVVISHGDSEKGVRLFRKINGWMEGAMNQL